MSAMSGFGHRQLRLNDHLRALVLRHGEARRAQMQPEVDGDAERAREHNVANPVQLHLTGLEHTNQRGLGEARNRVERDCDGGGEREGSRSERRRGSLRPAFVNEGTARTLACADLASHLLPANQ